MRIQKFIAECGLCSRRAAEELVEQGKITVNKKPAQIGQDVDPEQDSVMFEGKRLRLKICDKQYFIFYKPRGVITSMKAQDDRSVIADLIKGIKGRVYPVGRLDRDSEGLLLLTDDGEAAQKLTHPSYHIPKTYRVTVKGNPSTDILDILRQGVELDEGEKTLPAEVFINKQADDKTVLHITINEGKNRQIRRMCDKTGLEVLLLKRIAVGDIKLGHLAPGEYRPLSDSEKRYLFDLLNLNPKTRIIKKKKNPADEKKRREYRQNKSNTKSIYERRFLKQFSDKKK